MIKNLLLGTVLAVAAAGAASAAPISGSFTAYGNGAYLTDTNTSSTAAAATRLDFGTYGSDQNSGNGFGTAGSIFIASASGSFLQFKNATETVSDIQISGTTANSVTSPFITFAGNPSLTLSFSNASVSRSADGMSIVVSGTGTFADGIAADTTIGRFTLSTSNTDGSSSASTFSFTTNAGVAAAVPEPASLAILGASLVGLGVIRRRKA